MQQSVGDKMKYMTLNTKTALTFVISGFQYASLTKPCTQDIKPKGTITGIAKQILQPLK